MERVSYGEFSAALHRSGAREQVPLNVTFEITRRCPLVCKHCYNNLPMGDRGARDAELSLEEHKRLLDELSAMGCLWLLYTGGEVLARPDFFHIYGYAKQRGFLITIFTNGTMITPEIADRLAALPPFAIEITLYGHTAETYERVTGLPGSYERCLRGIRLLTERKLPLRLKSVALTLNKHELEDMRGLATQLGLPFKFDAMMSPRLDCSQAPLDVRLSAEEGVELDLRDPRRMVEWGMFVDRFTGPNRPQPAGDNLYTCGGGITSFAVDPYGGMSICVLSERERYDLRAGSVAEGWNHFLRKVRTRKITRQTKCTRCEIKSLCGMCPAHGELENSDPEAPVDFLCEVAHLRAKVLGLEVPAHGDCEYCAGGEHHPALEQAHARLEQAARLPLTPGKAGRSGRRRSPALAVVRDAAPARQTAESSCSNGSCGGCGDG